MTNWLPPVDENAGAPVTTSAEIEAGLFNLAVAALVAYRSEGYSAEVAYAKLMATLDALRDGLGDATNLP